MKAIKNKQFALYLSGISDLYEVFSEVANICQTVDLLPHERYDMTVGVIEKFTKMKDCIKHQMCVEISKKEFKESNPTSNAEATIKCIWPRYHEDLNTLQSSQKYKNLTLPLDYPSKLRQTRMTTQSESARLTKDVFETVEINLQTLNKRLYDDLKK